MNEIERVTVTGAETVTIMPTRPCTLVISTVDDQPIGDLNMRVKVEEIGRLRDEVMRLKGLNASLSSQLAELTTHPEDW